MYLYIAGRGHSGSTILDILLGNSAAIESVGELVSDIGKETGGQCSCGLAINDCPYWQAVRAEVTADGTPWREAATASVRQAHIRNQLKTWFARRNDPSFTRLAAITARFEQAIAKVSGKPNVLDSSKEPTRALFLARFYPGGRVIHLVRDPRNVLGSHAWRFVQLGGYFQFLRRKYHVPKAVPLFAFLAAGSWTVGNLICEGIARLAPGRVIRVRYEDLCDRPVQELRRIGKAFGLDLEDLIAKIEQGQELEVGHNIGGNAIRHKRRLRFDPHKGGTQVPPRWIEAMTLLLCWPLMLAYGYPLRRPTPPTRSIPDGGLAGRTEMMRR